MKTMRIYTFSPTRNKLIYSGSLEFWSPGVDEFFEGIFCSCLVVEDFTLQEAVEMLEEVVVSWREIR